jgi:pimeloyl-ACP methyl ester carboxylesterase
MGPVNEEMSAVAAANLVKPLTQEERERLRMLSAQRQLARAAGDETQQRELHLQIVELRLRAWFADPGAAHRFMEMFRSIYGYQPAIAPFLLPSVDAWHTQLDRFLPSLRAPVLFIYGYQDFEPITQAFLLQQRLPDAQIRMINECGHVPWIEQPEIFYDTLIQFLAGNGEDSATLKNDKANTV